VNKPEVIIINCPAWGVDLPPLGVAYVAADLENKGISCDVVDLNILLYSASDQQTRQLWKMENYHMWSREDNFQYIIKNMSNDIDWWATHFVKQGVRMIGFSITGANILFSIAMARAIKSKHKNVCIVFGGPSCNFLHDNARMPFRFLVSVGNGEPLLENGIVDYIVLGEGEGALSDIVVSYKSGSDVHRAGVVKASFPSGQGIRFPGHIDSLDEIPFPAWEKFPLDKYVNQDELPILFSRGCINKCSFCNDWGIRNGVFQCRSARNIFEEISYVQRKFRRNIFRCHDLLFNGNLHVLSELADLIIKADLGINWTAQGVIRKDMDSGFLHKLRMSGLITIVYGVESLSDNVLKAMGKRFTFEDIRLVLERTKKAGINIWINLIIGFPTETEEDFLTTLRRITEIRDYLEVVSSLNPCHITASTNLEKSPEMYGVKFRDGDDRCDRWESLDGRNTFDVRNRRMRETVNLLRKLGIRTNFVGMPDVGSDSVSGGQEDDSRR
jgi:anaerobic magnesium-protoporphyrin IX monomethyl ester cyclase